MQENEFSNNLRSFQFQETTLRDDYHNIQKLNVAIYFFEFFLKCLGTNML